jgi:prepilin-type N-terminal cleavage/methylation domain-containing protein
MLTYFKYTIFSLFSRRGRNAGFTLVELLVVISIATIILTALIIQQSTWNDTLSLRTQNYELSLILRQAQVHSLGVREDTSGSGDKFGIGYGVYFDHNQRDRYLYFADRNGDGNYDPSELVETYFLKRGVTLDKFCAVLGNNESCSGNLGVTCVWKASVTFKRPSVAALFKLRDTSNGPCGSRPELKIYLISKNGKRSSVSIQTNGQISVNQ